MTKTQTSSIEPKGCSVIDAGKAIGVSRGSVYKLLADGRLKSAKVGKRRIIFVDSISELLEALSSPKGVNHE